MNGRGFSNPDSSYSVTMSSGECARLLSKNEKVRFEPQIILLCTFNNLRAFSFVLTRVRQSQFKWNIQQNLITVDKQKIYAVVLFCLSARLVPLSSRSIMTPICRALLLQQVDYGVAISVPSFTFTKFGKTREKLRLCQNVIVRARIAKNCTTSF